MRPVRIITAVIFAAAVAVTGCTTYSTPTDPSVAPAPRVADTDPPQPTSPISHHRTQTDKPTPTAPPAPRQLHFATPQAAMGYLASAYNRNDLAALKHVTTPEARNNLLFRRCLSLDAVPECEVPGRRRAWSESNPLVRAAVLTRWEQVA